MQKKCFKESRAIRRTCFTFAALAINFEVNTKCIFAQACGVMEVDGIIIAIGKHVIAQKTLAGGGKRIRVDESAGFGVVITALEIIQAGLLGLLIAKGAKMGCF